MPINKADTMTAAGEFPVVEGPVSLRAYGSLPSPSLYPAGTLVSGSAVGYKPHYNDGAAWQPVGGSAVSVQAPLTGDGSSGFPLSAAAFLPLAGGTMTGALVSGIADPNGPHTLAIGPVDFGVWMKITAGDVNPYVDFYGTYNSTSNPVHNDNVFHLGHNIAPGGGVVIAGRSALADSWESYFDGGHVQSERHMKWIDTLGNETRFVSFEGHDDDGSTALFIDATQISIGSGRNGGAIPSLAVTPTTTTLQSPSALRVAIFDDDGGGSITLVNGVLGDTARAQVNLSSNGSVFLQTKQTGGANGIGRLMSSGSSPNLEWDNTLTRMNSPSGQTQVVVDANEQVTMVANGQLALLVQGGQTFLPNKRLHAQFDNVGTNTRGDQITSLFTRNTTAATALAPQQFSPALTLTGYGWTGSVSRAVSFMQQVMPDVVGGAGKFAWSYSNDEANYASIMTLNSVGNLVVSKIASPSATSYITVDDTQVLLHSDSQIVLDAVSGSNGLLKGNGNTIISWANGGSSSFFDHIMIGTTATPGVPTQPSTKVRFRGSYHDGFNGVAYEAQISNVVDTTDPSGHLLFGFAGSEVARLASSGVFGVTVSSGDTAALSIKNGASASLSAAGEVKLRSNAGAFEVSANGAAWAAVGGGSFLPLAGGTMTGAITFSGTQLGTYTLGGTPTLGASLAIGTTATYAIGDTTHLLTRLATARIIGGASNTSGHVVPNVADDTFALLAASQALTNKTISGASNTLSSIGNSSLTNSSIVFANGTGISGGATVALGGTYTPAVDQTTAFAWTAAHTWTIGAVGTAQTVGNTIQNTTAALVGAQQYSPGLALYGKTWETTGGTSQTGGWLLQSQGVNATTATSNLAFYHNVNGSLNQLAVLKPSTSTGFILASQTAGTNLELSGNGLFLRVGSCVIGAATQIAYTGAPADSAGAVNHDFLTNSAMVTAGAAVARFKSSTNTGTYVGVYSGDSSQAGCIARDFIADTGGVTAGKVVVLSGATGKITDAAATNNLTTVVGVALATATSGNPVRVMVYGPCKVNADAGITVGQLVGTSSGTAGNVQSGVAPGAGAILGKAMEATGGTTSGKVYVFLTLA